ncbi:glycoside hydrolase family 31 protein [Botryobasidium botryosum FD-172 SS1]|uniref:alpha-D-xyloside xylohydrolase n=1 Tax=Botryobasidium botryosum (strain FD-172 SS1) TaxID=930990 RepID=A0A067MCA2_BOTB1|nr:glycoside hydrolase family 31 protein [Botryobasidium botryosum FD-172 SS1]
MKFNDGFWLLKHGVKPYYGLQVVHSEVKNDAYHLQVSTKPIRHRGDTLGGPLLLVKVHSPTEGVIGVSIDHFKHTEPAPNIVLFPNAQPAPNASLFTSDNKTLQLSTGGLTAEITSEPYTITFRSPARTLTAAGYKHQALIDVPHQWTLNSAANTSTMATDVSSNPNPPAPPATVRYVNSELNISPGELIYGLGEQFGPFVKNGQAVSIWNRDGGTSSEQAYKCVPFYISNRGYGVFINHPGEVEVEVGSEKVSRVGVSVAGESLEYFVIYGETPLQILERYTLLTGRPALPPSWTFGLWLSTSFLTDYSAKTVSGFLEGMRERECHVRVFHLDCFWMKQYEWCSFTFDPENFPDPKAYLSEIKAKYGVKICVWINPYISQLSPIFDEAVQGGYLIKRTDGTPWQWDGWQPGMGVVDFTNPAACKWYAGKLTDLLDLGVDSFKTDFGERIPHVNVAFHDGSDPMRMHNTYPILYNDLVFSLLEKRFGKHEAVVFARSSAAGGQRFPVHWGGDCESTFEAMAETIRGGLSLTVSGFAFHSHDIGGFEGHPPAEIYHRWVAFGLFSSHSRLHGSSSYRVPWIYGEEASKTLAKFVAMKHRLMPYLYQHAIEAHLKGHPIQRAMFLEFLSDRTTHTLDRQYMLGRSLLVAPVFVPADEETEYYLPAGTWTSLFDPARTLVGPAWVREKVALDDMPLWVRPNSVLVLGPEGSTKPDYELARGVEVRVYELEDGESVEVDVPTGRGAEVAGAVRARRSGAEVTVDVVGGEVELASVALLARGAGVIQVVKGVKKGERFSPETGAREVVLKLESAA